MISQKCMAQKQIENLVEILAGKEFHAVSIVTGLHSTLLSLFLHRLQFKLAELLAGGELGPDLLVLTLGGQDDGDVALGVRVAQKLLWTRHQLLVYADQLPRNHGLKMYDDDDSKLSLPRKKIV